MKNNNILWVFLWLTSTVAFSQSYTLLTDNWIQHNDTEYTSKNELVFFSNVNTQLLRFTKDYDGSAYDYNDAIRFAANGSVHLQNVPNWITATPISVVLTDEDWSDFAENRLKLVTIPNPSISDRSATIDMEFDGITFHIKIRQEGNSCPECSNENYSYQAHYQKAYKEADLPFIPKEDILESVTYYDDLGRPVQHVGIRQSSSQKDIIIHQEYDAYGKSGKEYLPYVPATTGNEGSYREDDQVQTTNTFYKTHFPDELGAIPNPYFETVVEQSPLNRVLEQAAPGEDWKVGNGHTIQFQQTLNGFEEVYFLEMHLTDNGIPVLHSTAPAFYESGALFKKRIKTENWSETDGNKNTTETFVNTLGQVVLTRTYALINNELTAHDTYNVYDVYGNLTFVIPPKAEVSDGISTGINSELSELCYQYQYDERNRLIEKQEPGKAREYIVYDELNRPVLTQNALQRQNNQWSYVWYDDIGRPITTGIYTYTDTNEIIDRVSQQELVTEALKRTRNYMSDYQNYQSGTMEVLTETFYDTYAFDLDGASIPSSVYDVTPTTRLKGLVTGSKTKVLGTNDWIHTLNCYDDDARLIYSLTKNNYLQTTDIVKFRRDFVGKINESISIHIKSGQDTIVVKDEFTFDHIGRQISHSQTVANSETGLLNEVPENLELDGTSHTNQPVTATQSIILKPGFTATPGFHARINPDVPNTVAKELISLNSYNELGQLQSKKVGGAAAELVENSAGLQTINYTYNIRGWLTNINEDNNTDNDLFDFGLAYNNPTDGTGLYNGNISQTNWRSFNDRVYPSYFKRSYLYTYNALNRITAAHYVSIASNGAYVNMANQFNVTGISYDKNGNILQLNRTGGEYQTPMDVLSYTYDTGNKLQSVEDSAQTDKGFLDGAHQADEYSYDQNGNMTEDKNKGITAISYNHLNLPIQVSFGSDNISYIYDATGIKLAKVVNENGHRTTTEYVGNYVYQDTVLQFFNTPEGYVTPTVTPSPSTNSGQAVEVEYVYQYKDHLGNIRLSYMGESTMTLQDNFDNSEVWYPENASIIQEDGALEVSIAAKWGGAKKKLSTNFESGDQLEIHTTIDKGSTALVGFAIIQYVNNSYIGVDNVGLLESGLNSFEYTVPQEVTQLGIKFFKGGADDDGTLTHFAVNTITVAKKSYEIVEESNYYPFGLKHKGYHNAISSLGNSTAQKFKYNGIELEESLDLHLYEMEVRQYDPALARWTGIDPVTHHNMSTYTAFDNNPVFWADPIGANSGSWRAQHDNGMGDMGLDNDPYYMELEGENYKDLISGIPASDITAMLNGDLAVFDFYRSMANQDIILNEVTLAFGADFSSAQIQSITNDIYGSEFYEFNTLTSQGAYSGDNIFFKTWAHYQIGGTNDLHVSTSALDFSFVSKKNLSYSSKTNTYSVNLFSLNKTSQTSLALGKVSLNSVGNNLYTINPDLYDFNIERSQGFSTRNIGTFGAGLIHGPVIDNAPIPFVSKLPFFGPSFYFGGPYEIHFHGTVNIKP